MPSLEIFQSLRAMERRRPDGQEWSLDEKFAMIAEAGYHGVDLVHGDFGEQEIGPLLERHDLAISVTAFPKSRADLAPAIATAKTLQARHLNIIGQVYPFEVEEGASTIRSWLEQCHATDLPVVIETHRDSITTDLLYTLQLLDAVPEMQLCADLSHFVVAREFSWPLSDEMQGYIHRVLERSVAFQGRIASREQIQLQVDFPQHQDWVDLFNDWWREGFCLWRAKSEDTDRLNFLCELGPKEYAMTGSDGFELSDRWRDALLIRQQVQQIWGQLSDA